MHASVADFIVDCLQNSIEANADTISLSIIETENNFSARIIDNGKGMTDDEIQKAVDPFYSDGTKHRDRKVGLGLPFMIQAVEQAGGKWAIESAKNKGTELFFSFPCNHIDTPPTGDLSNMILQTVMFDGNFEFKLDRSFEINNSKRDYKVSRNELMEVLGDLNSAESLIMARQFLKSQEEYLIKGDR